MIKSKNKQKQIFNVNQNWSLGAIHHSPKQYTLFKATSCTTWTEVLLTRVYTTCTSNHFHYHTKLCILLTLAGHANSLLILSRSFFTLTLSQKNNVWLITIILTSEFTCSTKSSSIFKYNILSLYFCSNWVNIYAID